MAVRIVLRQAHEVRVIRPISVDFCFDSEPFKWAASDDVPGLFSAYSFPCDGKGSRFDNWGEYMHYEYTFSDPNVALEFKLRFF
jgi:hypothetical protein